MKCTRCGYDGAPQAAFCSRCGASLAQSDARAAGREMVLLTVRPSWSHFLVDSLIAFDFVAGGLYLCVHRMSIIFGAPLVSTGFVVGALVIFAVRRTTWTLTSERLIAHHALFGKADAEITLTDTRSINVVRSQLQKLLFDTGSVVVASLSNAARQMRIDDIPHPDGIAQTIKEARRKRFA